MSSNSFLFADANDKINKLYNWFCANKLYLNATKTKYIVISPSNKHIATNNHNKECNNLITLFGPTAKTTDAEPIC